MRDLGTLLNKIADGIIDDFGFENCDLFLLNEEKDAYVLRLTKGYPVILSGKVEGFSKPVAVFRDDLAATDRLGRFTYVLKADTSTTKVGDYYGLLHPEKAE